MRLIVKSLLALLLLNLNPFVASSATTVTNIVAAYSHDLYIMSDGSLWGMGLNNGYQLGDGTTNNATRPQLIVGSNVMAIAGGVLSTYFLKSDGSLWAVGYNSSGELGDGTFNPASTPEQIVANGVVAIAGGYSHGLFIDSNQNLWAMGLNMYGQLGDGHASFQTNKAEIVACNVVAVAGGGYHSLFLKSDRSLWGMGGDESGELGDGAYNSSGVSYPEELVASNVIAIAAGGFHSLFVKNDGSLWAMGRNSYGQLGDGTFNNANRPEQIVASNVVAVAAGGHHSLFVKSDGTVWGMGRALDGQLGDGRGNYVTLVTTNLPEQICSNCVAISAGVFHSIYLTADGKLCAMGDNSVGELGDAFTNAFSPFPEQIVPSPPPVLASSILSKTNLQFQATCQFGGTFFLLFSTNISLPASQWVRVSTNHISYRATNNFSVTITNGVNCDRQFYILQSQ